MLLRSCLAAMIVLSMAASSFAFECQEYKSNPRLDALMRHNFADGTYALKIEDCKGYCVAAKNVPLDGFFFDGGITGYFEGHYGPADAVLEDADLKLIQYCIKSSPASSGKRDAAGQDPAMGDVLAQGIHFDTGKADIKPEAEPALRAVADQLKADPALRVRVVGHTDNQGGMGYNLSLSERRAAAVAKALTDSYGVAADRLAPFGVGYREPVASNENDQGRAANRRVELVKPVSSDDVVMFETMGPKRSKTAMDQGVDYSVFIRFERDKPVKKVNYTISRQTQPSPPLQLPEGKKAPM